MSSIHASNAQKLLDLNPQTLNVLDTDFSSSLIRSNGFKSRFLGFVKWASRIVRHSLTTKTVYLVLQETCTEVQAVLKQLMEETPPRFFQTFQNRVSFINQWRHILTEESLNKLRSIFGRFQLSVSPLDFKAQNRILSLRAIADIETALRTPFPVELFLQLSKSDTLTDDQKVELQTWFSLFNREAGFITPKTFLYALQGSLILSDSRAISSLSVLVWRLKSLRYISFNRLDYAAEAALRQFHEGSEIAGRMKFTIAQKKLMSCFGEYGIELYTTLSGHLLLTSDNPFKLLTWLGALLKCVHVASTVEIVDFDPQYRWLAIEGFEATLDNANWHQSFPSRVHECDLPLLSSVSLLVRFCIQNRISNIPPAKTFVVVKDKIKTLVPYTIDPDQFSLPDIAKWVFEAVGKDTIRYREVLFEAFAYQDTQYKFFLEIVERVLNEKDNRGVVEIADSFAISSKPLREQAEQYALALHQFKFQCLKQLISKQSEGTIIHKIAAFLQDRHLLFFVDEEWIKAL